MHARGLASQGKQNQTTPPAKKLKNQAREIGKLNKSPHALGMRLLISCRCQLAPACARHPCDET